MFFPLWYRLGGRYCKTLIGPTCIDEIVVVTGELLVRTVLCTVRCGVSALVRNARAWCRHVARGRTTRDYKAVPSSPHLSSPLLYASISISTRGCPFYNFLREFLINGRRRVNRACAWALAVCAVHALLLLHRPCVVLTLRRRPPSPSLTHLCRRSLV